MVRGILAASGRPVLPVRVGQPVLNGGNRSKRGAPQQCFLVEQYSPDKGCEVALLEMPLSIHIPFTHGEIGLGKGAPKEAGVVDPHRAKISIAIADRNARTVTVADYEIAGSDHRPDQGNKKSIYEGIKDRARRPMLGIDGIVEVGTRRCALLCHRFADRIPHPGIMGAGTRLPSLSDWKRLTDPFGSVTPLPLTFLVLDSEP